MMMRHRGMPRLDHSQKEISCPSVVETMAMTMMLGAPPSGVPMPPSMGAIPESVHKERVRLFSGLSPQDRTTATEMEMNRMTSGILGAMADMSPAPSVNTRIMRTGLERMNGRLKHQ